MKSTIVFRILKKDQIHSIKQFSGEDRIVIGNTAEAHINLGSEVSPIHCVIERRGEHYYLCDMGSEKGTYKGNKAIVDEKLIHGDEFSIGTFKFYFFVGSSTGPSEVRLDKNQSLSWQTAAQNINNVNTTRSSDVNKTVSSPIEQILKPGKGARLEVMVNWHERVLQTYHFSLSGIKHINLKHTLEQWRSHIPQELNLLISTGLVSIVLPDGVGLEVVHNDEKRIVREKKYELKSEEICFIKLQDGLQIIVRFAPESPKLLFDSPLMLGSSELTGILSSLIIATMTSLFVSVYKPKAIKEVMESERVVQVNFDQFDRSTPVPITSTQETAVPQVVPAQEKNEKIAMPVTVVSKEVKNDLGLKGKAASVRPSENKSKIKMFTSTKPGSAVKTGANDGANAKSQNVDIKNSGLLAAFGVGGAREKLDQAYTGSGQLIGESAKATGNSGFKQDRNGRDLGTKTKDTGAGGTGTATQGIPDLNLKGSGSGLSYYGSGDGLGEKGHVQISVGAGGESIMGSIDKEAVRRVVRHALPLFKACYEREYRKDTSLKGRIVVRWEIDENGTAKNAKILTDESSLNNVPVQECVKLRMLGLKFPETPAGTFAEVTYPFLFEGPKN